MLFCVSVGTHCVKAIIWVLSTFINDFCHSTWPYKLRRSARLNHLKSKKLAGIVLTENILKWLLEYCFFFVLLLCWDHFGVCLCLYQMVRFNFFNICELSSSIIARYRIKGNGFFFSKVQLINILNVTRNLSLWFTHC